MSLEDDPSRHIGGSGSTSILRPHRPGRCPYSAACSAERRADASAPDNGLDALGQRVQPGAHPGHQRTKHPADAGQTAPVGLGQDDCKVVLAGVEIRQQRSGEV